MPYTPSSNYYGYSGQNATTSNYSTKNGNATYSQQMNNDPVDNGARATYNNSAYDWSGTGSSYTGQSRYDYNEHPYRQTAQQSEDYGRSSAVNTQSTTVNGNQSWSYYGRDQGQVEPEADGLHNLAYASGLDATQNRSNKYQQNSSRSLTRPDTRPSTEHSQYSLQPTSRSTQPEHSTSSSSNQYLAMNAAAALAGAVGRRYSGNLPRNSTSPATTSARITAASTCRTASPQAHVHDISRITLSHQSNQSRYPHIAQPHSSLTDSPHENPNYQHGSSHDQAPLTVSNQNVQSTTSRSKPSDKRQQTSSGLNTTPAVRASSPKHRQVEVAPSYIDPIQVFDPHRRDHERRRQEAKAAEEQAARDVEHEIQEATARAEAEAQTQQTAATTADKPKKKRKPRAKNASATEVPLTDEQRKATEMLEMMEKMKAMQNQNPELFQKLWENTQNSTPSASANKPKPTKQKPKPRAQAVADPTMTTTHTGSQPTTSTSVLPPTSVRPSSNSVPSVADAGVGTAQTTPTPKLRSGRSKEVSGENLNGYKVIVEHNPEGLPDLGRFPAERRIRTSYGGKDIKKTPAKSPQQQVQQALDAREQDAGAGTTIWPVDKRNALTATALKALKENSENTHISLTESVIHKMLERNPSYIQLCELLEAKGLNFHRGHFARELLNGIPELATAGKKTATPAVNKTNTDAAAAVTPSPAPNAQAPPLSYTASQPMSTGAQQPQFKKPKPPPRNKDDPLPGSKEAAAQKRDFSELVDLTEMEDYDEYQPPAKQPRLDGSIEPVSGAVRFADWQKPVQHPATIVGNGHPTSIAVPSVQPLSFNTQPHAAQPAEVNVEQKKMILARPINKTEALQKAYYDPRTVAKDILIASGRHPVERPLNVHLAGLLQRHIELDSDVSTFEWDEIDPGGPPAPKVELAMVSVVIPKFKIGDRVKKSRGPRRAKTKTKVAEKTRLPDTETRQDKPPPLHIVVKSPSTLRHGLLVTDATPATQDPTSVGPQAPVMNDSEVHTPAIRKRGRPPGSKNKFSSLSSMQAQTASLTADTPPNPYPTTKEYENRFKCRWSQCNVVLHNLDTLRKHIARVHMPSPQLIQQEGYTCWWKKCRYLQKQPDDSIVSTKLFDNSKDWLIHIEKDHVSPIAWKYGDGPSTKHIDPITMAKDQKRYLSNALGQQVTPICDITTPCNDTLNLTVIPRPDESDTEESITNRKAYRAFLKAHEPRNDKDNEKEREKKPIDRNFEAKQVFEALKKRKRELGMGMIEKGGCVLITQEMRERFVSGMGMRREVDIDY